MNRLFKHLLAILVFAGTGVYAQCPQNIGFEDGTFTNWEAYVGEVVEPKGEVIVSSTAPQLDRHRIMQASDESLDEFGHFPTVSPNGSKYSVKLGNAKGGHQAERLTYTFTVPQVLQYVLVLNYALVLQNPKGANHTYFDQPRFAVTVFNVTDNTHVSCPAFNFIAADGYEGFKISDSSPVGIDQEVTYKDWTVTTIDLSLYAGKTIKLEFTTNDCTFNAHFGYAYFDINEICGDPIAGNIICGNPERITLQGPKGFESYAWYKADDLTQKIGDKPALELSPLPAIGTKYVLKLTTVEGLGCPGTFTTTIKRFEDPYVFIVKPVDYFCKGTTFDLTAPFVTTGSVNGLSFEYYTDEVTQAYLRHPEKITEPGVYYIRGTNAGGCTAVRRIELKFSEEVATVTKDPAPVTYPTSVDLSSTYQKDVGYTYTFFKDEKATQPVDDYQHVNASGKYYIKVIAVGGCQKILSVNVTILPPPPFTLSGPTVFTPNNDGINDIFILTVNGFLDYGTLSIYNRAGQFLYKTNKQNLRWDGNVNGKPMPQGTYYWVFDGVDLYYRKKFNRSGYVSIIK